MATRGTYKIDGNLCYNHCDNYPSGAAYHMLEVLKNYHSASFFSFVRGMKDLQPTTSIFDGPAEFHYKIEKDRVMCYEITLDEKMKLVSFGEIAEWVTSQLFSELKRVGPKDFFEPGEDERDIKIINYQGRYFTARQIEEKAISTFQMAEQQFEKGMWGNSSGNFSDAFKLFKLINKGINLKSKYLKYYSPVFARQYQHQNTLIFDSYAL
jgi:hypothetical protein